MRDALTMPVVRVEFALADGTTLERGRLLAAWLAGRRLVRREDGILDIRAGHAG